MGTNRRLAAALAGAAAVAAFGWGPPARAQDAQAPVAPAPAAQDPPKGKEAKVRRFLEAIRWKENLLEQLDAGFDAQAKTGMLPKGFAKKFREVADLEALEDLFAGVWSEMLDEATLDAVIAFHKTDAGKKYVEASMKMTKPMMEKIQPWAMENAMKAMQALMESGAEDGEEGEKEEGMEGKEEDEGGVLGDLKKARHSSNETAAIATLRNLASSQAQVQTSGKIDCDQDGIGEYGTFLELTGSAGVRKGFEDMVPTDSTWNGASDFSKQGAPVKPALLSPALAGVDADGIVVRSGYCFRIYLPDTTKTGAGFVHEMGPKDKVALAGGTGKVCVNLAETTWCAYAWPEKREDSGNRVFFVNQAGDVFHSANEKAGWEGREKAPPPDAAFRGAGITSPIAVGTAGRDGEVWKVTN